MEDKTEWKIIISIYFIAKKTQDTLRIYPDLKHCSSFGETQEEALQEVLKTKAAWLEVARTTGKAIPKPRYHLLIYQDA